MALKLYLCNNEDIVGSISSIVSVYDETIVLRNIYKARPTSFTTTISTITITNMSYQPRYDIKREKKAK